tara:strand:+ start:1221 stop:2657 length:1437 start_codon:yes stop_codon:yes gene_type:complete
MDKFNWEFLDVKEMERSTQCAARGEDNGRREIPETSENVISEAENDIYESIYSAMNSQIDECKAELKSTENKVNEKEEDIRRDRFADMHSNLSTELGIILNNFNNKIKNIYEEWLLHRRAYEFFRTENRIDRPYIQKSNLRKAISLFVVFFFATVEIIGNQNFLSTAVTGGQREAITLATAIAFINVGISAFVGALVMRQLNHFKFSNRVIFGSLLAIYILFLIWLNFSMGAYRTLSQNALLAEYNGIELPTDAIWNLGASAMAPWLHIGILDPSGWALIVMGIAFAAIGLFDGYQFDDVYPGYGKVGNKMDEKKNEYLSNEKKFVDEGNKIYRSTIKSAKDFETADDHDRQEWSGLINTCQDVYLNYEEWVKNTEKQILAPCILHYRNQNKKIRRTPAPEYFKNEAKIDQSYMSASSKFASSYENCFYSDKDRKDKLIEWEKLNKDHYNNSLSKLKKIKEDFDQKIEAKKNELSLYL